MNTYLTYKSRQHTIILFVILITTSSFSVHAQDKFPDKCLGQWTGKMYMYNQGLLRDSVDVILTIKAIDATTWVWKTEYLSKKLPMVKDYKLRFVENNVFITDEGDGIELLNYQFENKLYSTFETHGIYLTANYELINDKLKFEVTSGKKKNDTNSVVNYSTDNIQSIIFSKIK